MKQERAVAPDADEVEAYLYEENHTPEDIAERLREVADMLEKGTVTLGDKTFEIPENVAFKLELEEEHNGDIAPVNFEIEVEIVFPVVLADY
jgi:amphi-Trp domain-containing protein